MHCAQFRWHKIGIGVGSPWIVPGYSGTSNHIYTHSPLDRSITNAPTRCHVPVRRIDSTEIHECAMQTVCVSPSVGLRPVRSSGEAPRFCGIAWRRPACSMRFRSHTSLPS